MTMKWLKINEIVQKRKQENRVVLDRHTQVMTELVGVWAIKGEKWIQYPKQKGSNCDVELEENKWNSGKYRT